MFRVVQYQEFALEIRGDEFQRPRVLPFMTRLPQQLAAIGIKKPLPR
jgi:hypothetical protein